MQDYTFIFYKILRRIRPLHKLSYRLNNEKHKKIMNQLNSELKLALSEANKEIQMEIKPTKELNNTIWLFWWQGEEKMPKLSKECYQSICQNRGHYHIILITKFNINQYAKLPNYIYEKLDNGQITYTHFSDILRFNLLSNYGGLWIDLTCLVTGSLDKIDVHSELFTTSDYTTKDNFNISRGRWTGFLMGGPSNLLIFKFMNKFFSNYWKNNTQLLDYFLIDYALDYAFEHNLSDFQKASNHYNEFAPHLFELQDLLSLSYDDPKVTSLLNSGGYIYKLSNRKKIRNINDPNILFNHLNMFY